MASTAGGRGRRKQAKPQRKQVELDNVSSEETVVTAVAASVGPMSPDSNHNNQQVADNNPKEVQHARLMNGCHKEAVIPEQVAATNGFSLQGLLTMQVMKSGGVAEDAPTDLVSAKAAVGEQQEEEQKIQEYLQRSDTAVIFPEPVGHLVNVPALTNGITKDNEETANAEHFIKCPQCQKGCSSFQSLKEHIESAHPHAVPEEGSAPTHAAQALIASPPPAAAATGPYACSQCTTSFTTKDQLEKHELLHSPNAQVSCKVCHKTFANVYRLQRHMISHDESAILRKFKCTECEKAFKFKHHLKEHIRIHSGEKPFECANCGKRFSHSGSYSSHMTSKKCLVMNLKMGRSRASVSSHQLLDKNQSQTQPQHNRLAKRAAASINNNSPNHAYLPILPKYPESAAAAAFLSVMAPRDAYPPVTATATAASVNPALHPFYMPSPALHIGASGHPIGPYTMSASLGQLLEHLQTNSPHRSRPVADHSDPAAAALPDDEHNKLESNGSEHAMDTDEDKPRVPSPESSSGDLEAINRILETVNATVTRQQLQANMQKLSTDSASSECRSVPSPVSSEDTKPHFTCKLCKKHFLAPFELESHECDNTMEIKSEGLAAKLEESVHVKTEDVNGENSACEEDVDADVDADVDSKHNDNDTESVTTTDHVSEDGRKVRVRSLIADEQLTILKDHYTMNPRPKREELARIAERIGFPVRVVQVWFQNTRARDRREGRLVQIPYSPLPAVCYPPSIVPSGSPHIPVPVPVAVRGSPYGHTSPQYHHHHHHQHQANEQPLDLSTKKGPLSVSSSPSSSPHRPASAVAHSHSHSHSDSGEEAVNLSQKSSRSPTPFHQLPYQPTHYQSSNCSSDYHRSPSPSPVHPDSYANGSRLARILAQPAHRLAMASVTSAMGLVPMDRLLHYNADLTASSSPNSERRSWKMEDNEDSGVSQEMYPLDDELSCPTKRTKVSQLALKGLSMGVPLLTTGTPEPEIEGQFICDQCDKAFSKQSSLARHKYEHSGQRPHKCDECPKAFKHKHHLTEHKRLHSGEKPFQCSKCLKRFSHSGSYSQHMNHRYSYCKPYRE